MYSNSNNKNRALALLAPVLCFLGVVLADHSVIPMSPQDWFKTVQRDEGLLDTVRKGMSVAEGYQIYVTKGWYDAATGGSKTYGLKDLVPDLKTNDEQAVVPKLQGELDKTTPRNGKKFTVQAALPMSEKYKLMGREHEMEIQVVAQGWWGMDKRDFVKNFYRFVEKFTLKMYGDRLIPAYFKANIRYQGESVAYVMWGIDPEFNDGMD